MTDAAARALAANTNTDPYAAERKAARREAAHSPLNGRYVTTAKSPRPGVRFTARVTPFGVEITPEGGEGTCFELMSAFRHDLAKGYIRPCLGHEAALWGGIAPRLPAPECFRANNLHRRPPAGIRPPVFLTTNPTDQL